MNEPRRRECLCPTSIVRCAHLDGDVVQAWRSEGRAYVIEGPHGQGTLGLPVYTYTRGDFETEWQHRVGVLRAVGASEPKRESSSDQARSIYPASVGA